MLKKAAVLTRPADGAPALVWMNGPDGCSFVNAAYLDFLGVSDADVRDFDWAQFVHLDDRKAYVTGYLEAVTERRLFDATFRLRRYDGEYRWMKSVGTPRFTDDGTFRATSAQRWTLPTFTRVEIKHHYQLNRWTWRMARKKSTASLETAKRSSTTFFRR